MIRSIIAAVSENNVVGKDNGLPWKLSADLKRLKSLTMGHHIIMGRKTWDSLGRALPGRVNVVITNRKDFRAEGAVVVNSLEEALTVSSGDTEIFIFGGAEIFRKALPLVDKIYFTRVHARIRGDAFFPDFNLFEWQETQREEHHKDDKNEYDYTFVTLERKK
jgi:dihydrofolate reductase